MQKKPKRMTACTHTTQRISPKKLPYEGKREVVFLFNNPGKKVQTLAKIIFWVIIIVFVIAAVGIAEANDVTVIGHIVLICIGALFGSFVGWLNSIVLYAFGSLVDDVQVLRFTLTGMQEKMTLSMHYLSENQKEIKKQIVELRREVGEHKEET